MSRFTDIHFLLKLIAFFSNLAGYIVYRFMDVYSALHGSRQSLYAHTIPAFLIIMFVLVLLYIMNERPGEVMCNVFLIIGSILSIILAVVLILILLDRHHTHRTGALILAILVIVNAVVYITDLLFYLNVCRR